MSTEIYYYSGADNSLHAASPSQSAGRRRHNSQLTNKRPLSPMSWRN